MSGAATVWALLKVAYVRSQARNKKSSNFLVVFSFIGALGFALICAMFFAYAAPVAQEVAAKRANHFLASAEQIAQLSALENSLADATHESLDEPLEDTLSAIARYRIFFTHPNFDERFAEVKHHFDRYGSAGFRERKGVFDSPVSGSFLMLMLAAWWLSLVLQSDGMELDTTRRRHPMWEYFLSLPVPQNAVYTAEAISPLIVNPFYWAAPAVIAGVVGITNESMRVGLAALPFGVLLVLAAAVCAKALEVLVMLRVAPRRRGACFVVLSGLGMICMFGPLVLVQVPKLAEWMVDQLLPLLAHLPSARWLLQADTPIHWLRALAVNLSLACGLTTLGIVLMRWAAARGLEAGFGASDQLKHTSAFANVGGKWWRDALLRKELIWLLRDRSAIIHILLLPCLLVASQAFYLNNMLRELEINWHRAAGLVIVSGGYMLFIAGPRALLSEAPALSLVLSWPRPLIDTLRAKVRVLFALISVFVIGALLALMWLFPADWLKLLSVIFLWPLFGLSVAEKAVTLIRAPASSGEPEPLPRETLWAAGLGNLAFGVGLFLGNWQVALLGLTLNWVLAGALWQAFELRLPYLFDPHSQPEVQPPTILSSVLALLAMQELGILISIALLTALGGDAAPLALALGYGAAGVAVFFAVWIYHERHSVSLRDIFVMAPTSDETSQIRTLPTVAFAVLLGIALAILAFLYSEFLQSEALRFWFPTLSAEIAKSLHTARESPNAMLTYVWLAVLVAPWAEEFLFRGLMFRAMLKQWGFAFSLLLSTTFFTLLHPVMAWPMVFLLGAMSAWLFVRTRLLLPCVLLHFVYNVLVILTSP